YNIEKYTDINDYPEGIQDENYYSYLWIPVKLK
ncbi:AraC family transcriptional regulator, partial [Clostridium perfringens]|nr:AraC family transcriptional regulator [Clostridium perfringens]